MSPTPRAAQQLRQRGKAPLTNFRFGELRARRNNLDSNDVTRETLVVQPQFTGSVTPPAAIRAQSTQQRELKPEQPHALRRQPKPRPVAIVEANHAPVEECRPASRPAEFSTRVEPVRFW